MRRNPLIVLLALSALLLSTTGSALADSHDEYIAEATGVGYSVSIAGEDAIFGGISGAEINSDPFAEAFGVGSSLDGDSDSEATAENEGDNVSDEGTGTLDDIPVLGDLFEVSSSAEARIIDGLPYAYAEADGLILDLGLGALEEVFEELFEQIPLEDILGEVEDQLLVPVRNGLAEACTELDGALFDPIFEALDPVFDGVDEILEASPEELEQALGLLDAANLDDGPCYALIELLLENPAIESPEQFVSDLLGALTDASLLVVELGTSESETEASAGDVEADATAVGLFVEIPGLNLEEFLQGLFGEAIDDFVETVMDIVDGVLDPVTEELPDELDLEAALLGLLDVLTGEDSLLSITAGDTWANAVFDRDTGDIETDGTAAPLTVCVAAALGNLLGEEDGCFTFEEGDEQVILEDTPLESRLAAGAVTMSSAERDGLEGEEVISEAVALQLINFEEDGETYLLDIASAESYAAVFGEVTVADEPEALPVTGGSAVPIALLLLAAGMLFTRRMRAPLAEREAS